MKYNRLSPRQGLGLANFKQWSEGGSSRSRAPVPRYRGTVTVRLCSISRMFYAAFLQLIPFPSISYPLWDELTKLDLSAGAEMVSRCGISKSVYDSWPLRWNVARGLKWYVNRACHDISWHLKICCFQSSDPSFCPFCLLLFWVRRLHLFPKPEFQNPKSDLPKLPTKTWSGCRIVCWTQSFSVLFIGFLRSQNAPAKNGRVPCTGTFPRW